MDVKIEKGRGRQTESKDNGGRRKLEPVQRLGWLPGRRVGRGDCGRGGG